jgi:hypothetical protein
MKWALMPLLVFACVGHGTAQAEPLCVTLEWFELDVTKCPELAARFQARRDAWVSAEKLDPSLIELQKKAVKRVLVRDEEWIEPGTSAKHTIRLEETTLKLDLTIGPCEKGRYEAAARAELTQGAELDAAIKPGDQLTSEQMKGVKKCQMDFKCVMAPDQSCVIGGLTELRAQEYRPLLAGLPDILSSRKNHVNVMTVLVIGIREPRQSKLRSAAGVTVGPVSDLERQRR